MWFDSCYLRVFFSREKIRPDKELQRARNQILNCKLGLRDAIRQLDLLSSVGSIEEEVMAPDGSIHHDHVNKSLFIRFKHICACVGTQIACTSDMFALYAYFLFIPL